MEGRKYNCAVRVHKLVYEALIRLAWKGFLPWLEANHATELHHLDETLQSIATFHGNVHGVSFRAIQDNISFTHITEQFQAYLEFLRSQPGLPSFWVSYLDMTEILLGLLRASREGD